MAIRDCYLTVPNMRLGRYSDLLDKLGTRLWVGDDCWEWSGSTTWGYGVVRHEGSNKRVHRVVYELLIGPIPQGLVLDHLCCNKRCANPGHLEAVTAAENNRRAAAMKKTCPAGHAYDERNTAINRRGARVCRACKRDKERSRQARLRNKGG